MPRCEGNEVNHTHLSEKKKQSTVVGDMGIKVVEHLVEADAAKKGEHFGPEFFSEFEGVEITMRIDRE